MNNAFDWYSKLIRPSWAPPSWLFGPVWTILYLGIAVSFGSVFFKAVTRQIPVIIAMPFVLNLVFNFAFSPIQFGLRNNLLAAVDILLVLLTIIWMFFWIWPHAKWVVWVNVPYLLWVSFATILQLTVTFLNWNK